MGVQDLDLQTLERCHEKLNMFFQWLLEGHLILFIFWFKIHTFQNFTNFWLAKFWLNKSWLIKTKKHFKMFQTLG